MAVRTRRTLSGGDTWAGFVDALSALLMVLIFALVVFMIAQLFQGVALTGQDQALNQLQARVAELTDMLALERGNNDEIRTELAQLSSELQRSTASRDDAVQALALLSREHDELLAGFAASQVLAQENERELEDARARIGLLNEDLDRALQEVTTGQGHPLPQACRTGEPPARPRRAGAGAQQSRRRDRPHAARPGRGAGAAG